MLSETDQSNLLKEFPHVELSYETNVHKKVYNSEFMLAIPEGKKCFAWFTTFKKQNVCVMMEVNENKKLGRIEISNVCFHDELSYGTILYGTVFRYENTKIYSAEDIYYYKGNNISNKSYVHKLSVFKNIFSSEIKQLSYFDNNIVFGLPVISNSFDNLVTIVDLLPYKIKCIQFRYLNRKNDSSIINMAYVKNTNYTQLLRLPSTDSSRSPSPSASDRSKHLGVGVLFHPLLMYEKCSPAPGNILDFAFNNDLLFSKYFINFCSLSNCFVILNKSRIFDISENPNDGSAIYINIYFIFLKIEMKIGYSCFANNKNRKYGF